MKPLTPLKYYGENKKRAFTVIAILTLAAAVVSFITSLIISITIDATKANLDPLVPMSLVMSSSEDVFIKDEIADKIKDFDEVERIYNISIEQTFLNTLVGNTSAFVITPDNESDMKPLLEDIGIALKDGRLPGGSDFEVALHERILANKSLKVGDYIGSDMDDNEWMTGKYKIVGTLSGDAIVSVANKNSYKENMIKAGLTFDKPIAQALIPKDGKIADMNEKIEQLSKKEVSYFTHSSLERMFAEQLASLNIMLFIIIFVVVFIVSISISALIYIVYMNRSEEFGILCAMGYRKSFINKLIIKELATISFVSWAVGYFFSWLMITLVNVFLLNAKGQTLYFFTPTGLINTLIIPVMVIICATFPILRKLKKWDPIAVIERRE